METIKDNIITVCIGIIIVFLLIGVLFLYIGYMLDKTQQELHERISDNINLSKPFNEVVAISSSFISGGIENWYYVSIQATTDEYPGSPQWIYDFRYDDNNDMLYYDDNIEGINVVNE